MRSPNRFAAAHFRTARERWAVTELDDPLDVAAAWLQFRLARELWRRAEAGRISVETLASQLGQSFEAQRKKLAGEQSASLRDLTAWLMVLGDDGYRILPREDADLLPATAHHLLGAWRSGGGTLPTFRAVAEPAWHALAPGLLTTAIAASSDGRGHLLTSDWLRQQVIGLLIDAGIPAQHMRLWSSRGADGLQLGLIGSQYLVPLLVSPVDATEGERATQAAWDVRDVVQALATRTSETTLVVMSPDALATDVLDSALPSVAGGQRQPSTEFKLGPFEPEEARPETAWWAHHQVQIRFIAGERSSSGAAVLVASVGKPSEF